MKGNNTIDMLNGRLLWPTIKFALPLIATGFLQQSFNSADALVVGRFCESNALAAVGSNGPVINLIITLFMGLGVGVNVVIASYIGRGDKDGAKRAVATTGVIALASGIILTVIGTLTSRLLLEALGTPDDVIDNASKYLGVFFLGMPFMMIYNFGAAVLRSVGDTARPFYILIAGCMANLFFDYYLTGILGWGVIGVAAGTVIGVGINATLIIIIMTRSKSDVRLEIMTIRLYRHELSNIIKIGLPAGIQGLVFSLSNVFILSAINSFGSAASAGSAAALNYEIYCYYIVVGFVQAAVAFTSQNYAAGKIERCKKIFWLNMVLSIILCCLINVVVVVNKDFFIGIFSTDENIIPYAFDRLTMVLMMQFIACSYEISGGALRAMGYSMTPTLLTIFGTCVFRLLWVFLLPYFNGSFKALMAIYPVTWIITGASVVAAYFIIRRKAFSHLTIFK